VRAESFTDDTLRVVSAMFASDQSPVGAQGHGHPDGGLSAFAELPCCAQLLSESEGQRKWIQWQNNSLEIETFVV